MPRMKSRHISVAFDMYGCPNACRHCWLGNNRTGRMSEEDVRWTVDKLRAYTKKGEGGPFIERLTVATSFREPDFSDNYEYLHELENELSDDKPPRYELLSVWRLARDKEYPKWAKSVGTQKCQISFFGLKETTDWFCRRKGAFRECVVATERLLDAGILPRWQLFLTKKILPELDDMMHLIDRLRLRDRAEELGGEFEFFLHTPGPDGATREIEYLRPTLDETKNIPAELIDASVKHFKNKKLWQTEGELLREIMQSESSFPYAYDCPERLWFFVTTNFDVYSNIGTLEPWWRLGNLKTDTAENIFSRFENNDIFGLHTIYNVSTQKIAKQFGDSESKLVYDTCSDLLSLYVAQSCEKEHESNKS